VTTIELRRPAWEVLRKAQWLQRVSLYDAAALSALALLVLIASATYGSYAISNDEPVQQHYGELIIAYYRSGFTDQALFHYQNLYLYGGLFDVLANLMQRLLPALDPYDVRHIFCALIGIGGIAGAWATARLVAGPRAGLIAALALAVCGPWYGAMFNHTKDIPFATAVIGASYFLLRSARGLPRAAIGDVFGFGILLGCALGMRVLGLLMVGYAALAILLAMPRAKDEPLRNGLAFFARSAIALSPAFAIAYAIMLAAWPWAALAPLNPVRGLIDFGDFHYHINTLLAGRVYEMAGVPRWYVPAYLLIKLPPVMLAGAAIAVVIVFMPRRVGAKPWLWSETALLAFMLLFPVACEVIDHGPAFTGMRHFLFVIPLAAVLAGIGLDWLIGILQLRRRWVAAAAAAVMAGLMAYNAALLIQLHPYEYLYYNPIVGGLPGAAGRYATDYWVAMMPEAVEQLEGYVDHLDSIGTRQRRYSVAVCGERAAFEDEADSNLQWTPNWQNADFFIAPTHMNCDRALDGRTIATISRLGVTIGVVKDRRALVSAQARN
jgi:Dolichyl-phosphate-mannose-protein mannosyltransferase